MKLNKKTLILLVCAALLLTFTVSGTVAYLAAGTSEVKNVFEPGRVIPEIIEPGWEDDKTVKQNVTVTNTGNVDAYIRAMIVVTWQDANGNVYPALPVSNIANSTTYDYTISLNTGTDVTDWTRGADGYYYYNSKVAAKASTTNLIDSCAPVAGKEPADGYTLHVEILAQAVQADGWPEGIDTAVEAFAEANIEPTTSGT